MTTKTDLIGDTVTLYRSWYEDLEKKSWHDSRELAYIQGTIKALAGMESNPTFVFESLKKMADKIEKGVDISA